MRNLNYELKQLCRRNRDGSYATQRDRERVLDLVASQLHEMGYRHMAAAGLKPKHVEGLVARWQLEGLAVGTIKNRMLPLDFDGPPPAFGAEVLKGELRAGEVLSGRDGSVMALLRVDRLDGDLTVDGRPVRLRKPAWMGEDVIPSPNA